MSQLLLPGGASLAPSLAEAQPGQVVAVRDVAGDLLEPIERATASSLWVRGTRYQRKNGEFWGAGVDPWTRSPWLQAVDAEGARRIRVEARRRLLIRRLRSITWGKVDTLTLERVYELLGSAAARDT